MKPRLSEPPMIMRDVGDFGDVAKALPATTRGSCERTFARCGRNIAMFAEPGLQGDLKSAAHSVN